MRVQRLPSNRDIAKKRWGVPPLSSAVVSTPRPRPAMARHARSLRDPRLRVDAPANSGLHGNRLLQRVAPPSPRFCLTGSGFRKRRASRVARPRLLQSCAKSSRRRTDRRRSISRTLPAISRANAAASRNWKIHCARRCQLRIQRISPHCRRQHCSCSVRLFDFRESIDSDRGRQALWQYAAMLVPKSNASIYNSALIDLGALVCVARQPKCGICPVEKFCRAQNPQTLPVRKSRLRTKRLIEKHAFVVRRGKILLERSSTRWRGMWILPPLQRESANQRPVYKSIFPFTDHRVTLSVYARHREKIRKPLQSWVRIDSLDSIPMPSPHRKALRHLLSERVIER